MLNGVKRGAQIKSNLIGTPSGSAVTCKEFGSHHCHPYKKKNGHMDKLKINDFSWTIQRTDFAE